MAVGQLRPLIQELRKLATPNKTCGLTDGELLERFVASRDEGAFELLAWRHGGIVLSVCRRLLRHEQDAEDAFQATFLVFVRKASSIGKHESVGGWLYKVAYRVALRARTRAARRRAREQPLADEPVGTSAAEIQLSDLRSLLDEEINRLPVRQREPFILCYVEGRTLEEAARQLGSPKSTIATRLARARECLCLRLRRRGVTLSAGVIAALLLENAVSASVPPSLVLATVQAARAFAAGGASAVSAGAAALGEGFTSFGV